MNYGLYCPPSNMRVGKYLDEERPIKEYPLSVPIGLLEVCRPVYLFLFVCKCFVFVSWSFIFCVCMLVCLVVCIFVYLVGHLFGFYAFVRFCFFFIFTIVALFEVQISLVLDCQLKGQYFNPLQCQNVFMNLSTIWTYSILGY